LTSLLVAALFLLSPYLGLLGGRRPSETYRNTWVFVGLTLIVAAACLVGLRRLARPEEARLRAVVGAAFGMWAANELGSYAFLGEHRPLALGAQDVTFVLFTVLMAFAALAADPAEERPGERVLRRLHRVELAVLFAGLFGYLIVLPARIDPEFANSSVPSASLNLTLDLLLLGLYLWRLTRARGPRERLRWRLLVGAAALFTLSDGLYLLWALRRFDIDRWLVLDLVWYAPHFLVVLAVRWPEAIEPFAQEPDPPKEWGDGTPFPRVAPSFLYAALVPVVHLVRELAGPGVVTALQAQRRFALLLTALLLLLAVVHQIRLGHLLARLRRELESGRRRRAAAERLEAVGRLAAGVAHDFNNLLTVIVGRADLLRQREDRPAPQRSLAAILELSERAADLTSELLAVGQRETTLREELVLDHYLLAKRDELGALAGERVRVVFELGAADERLQVDPRHLDRILANLVTNARDAMPDGGDLIVRTRRRGVAGGTTRQFDDVEAADYLSVEVADTGIGMTAEVLDRLFDPFFTTKPRGRGIGLGLATVRGLVRQNGGQIVARSRAGAGTSFELLFPPAER